MPIESPFFIKRYISNDVAQSGVSKWFWFYPADSLQLEHGAIGMFFEVTYSVSADSYLEDHLIKLVWDFFTDAYYDDTVILTGLNRFKLAVKKSVQRLINLVEESGISEGIDVNILYITTILHSEDPHKSKIYLARVGEMDVFLVRKGEHLSLQEIIPDNDLVKPILAGVGELEKNDIVLISNRELISTSLDSSMLNFTSGWHALLDSLDAFQTNLFGNKQIIVLGFPEYKDLNLDKYNKIDSVVPKQALLKPKSEQKMSSLDFSKKNVVSNVSKGIKIKVFWWQKIQRKIQQIGVEMKKLAKKIIHLGQQSFLQSKIFFKKKDFKLPVNKVEKTEKFVLDKKLNSKKEINSLTKSVSKIETPVMPVNKVKIDKILIKDVSASSFRRQRSSSGKLWITLQQKLGLFFQQVLNILPLAGKSKLISKLYGVSKVSSNNYKSAGSFGKNKIFIYLAIILIISSGIWMITSKITYNKKRKALLIEVTQYKSTYTIKNNQVLNEPTDDVFVKCMNKADTLVSNIFEQLPDFKTSGKEDTRIQDLYTEVQRQQTICQTQYDRYNKIARVQETNKDKDYAVVLTDFDVVLGNGSKVVDMAYKGNTIYIADQGKKAAYQYNTANNNTLKLEDPQKLIVSPSQIAVNRKSGEVYVWDKENGLLEYKNNQGFKRVTSGGLDLVGGQVSSMEVFVGNIYYTLEDKNVIYRMDNTSSGFSVGVDYFSSDDFVNISDILVDGNIYIALDEYTKQPFYKYYGGKKDTFAFINEGSYQLGAISAGYTGVQESQPLYVFDREQKTIVAIEKPSPKNHPGKGIYLYRIIYGGERKDVWQNVQEIILSVDGDNKEQGLYLLDGSLLWRIKLGSLTVRL